MVNGERRTLLYKYIDEVDRWLLNQSQGEICIYVG